MESVSCFDIIDAVRAVDGLGIWIYLKGIGIGGFCLVFLVIGRGDVCDSGIFLSCLLISQNWGGR